MAENTRDNPIVPELPPAPSKKFFSKRNLTTFIIIILIIAGIGIYMTHKTNSSATGLGSVILHTTEGDITIELDKNMPITAGNFQSLVQKGFYNGVIFHRVIDGFMIQGGDPTGTGAGGPGYQIKDEFTSNNRNDRGTISMANAGPNTGGSQFFINLVDNNFLDKKHPVFGRVVKGMDVVDKIAQVPVDASDRPLKEVKIITAEVIN